MAPDGERAEDPYRAIQKSGVLLKRLLDARNSSFVRMITGDESARAEPTEMTVARTINADNVSTTRSHGLDRSASSGVTSAVTRSGRHPPSAVYAAAHESRGQAGEVPSGREGG